jgi:DNA-binding NarL/FixJ family response regulator
MTQVEKILLVEDHPLVRAGCRRVLRAIRATVLEATTGAAALRINRDEQPNIIFLDISLPDINGADMLEKLRTENVGVQVIILRCTKISRLPGDLSDAEHRLMSPRVIARSVCFVRSSGSARGPLS